MPYAFNVFTGTLDYYQVVPPAYGGVPHYIPEGETHTTPENKQEVVAAAVRNDGVWVIDGIRVFL